MSGTPARKRINATEQSIVARSISGSLQQVVGSLAWGPRFGKNNDDTFVAAADGPILESVDFTATLSPQATIDLASLELEGALAAQGVVDLASIDLLGALAAQAAVDLDEVALEGDLGADARINLFSVNPTGNLPAQASVDLDALDLDGNLAAAVTRTEFRFNAINWADAGAVHLDETAPDTAQGASGIGTVIMEARAQSPLANDRIHAYAWWDVGGTFKFEPTDGLGFVETLEITLAVNHNAGVVNNPAQLFWELYDGDANEPMDESSATWNNDEGEHTEPGYNLADSGSIVIDNTDPPDYTDPVGQEYYIVTISVDNGGRAVFRNEVENGNEWWLLRLVGDTRLGQDNVLFEIAKWEDEPLVDGVDPQPSMDFRYRGD